MSEFSLQEALQQKILPAITFDDYTDALPIAEALLKAGLNVMEIPFRTNAAEFAITSIRKNLPEMHVGGGTLLTKEQIHKAINAGAQFGLSPGFNQNICAEAKRLNFPFIPGVMTPSEMELANELGYDVQKIFPAEQLGGISFLKAMLGPYQQLNIKFIPMGGVNLNNMNAYLQLKNVIAVGGSWLATKELIASKNYKSIEENVVAALHQTKIINAS
ncbi:MAG TPA: bifunctional 4-hydroxy-2-oxoglutarate aldolase/2-dehydro-3-deoxy-phosphogluconate aldolase [Puia sp.]|nr:bifunctional 4-hydroxy-2-oxoglutarate aldolase/2-dehydro-3-deoxy-phosphogluconate aldolase [Puia sp.]